MTEPLVTWTIYDGDVFTARESGTGRALTNTRLEDLEAELRGLGYSPLLGPDSDDPAALSTWV